LDQLKDILSLAGKGRIAQVYISKPYTVDIVGEPISYESMQEIGVSPDMVNSAPLIGAPEAWNLGYTGSGRMLPLLTLVLTTLMKTLVVTAVSPMQKYPMVMILQT